MRWRQLLGGLGVAAFVGLCSVLASGIGSAVLANGPVMISGTDGDDEIVVEAGGPDAILVTLNGVTDAYPVATGDTVAVAGLGGDDAVTILAPLAVSLAIDGGADTDSLTFLGTAGADDITLTGTAISITGSGTIGYAFFESATILGLDGDDTIAVAADLTTALDVNGGNDSDAVSVDQPVAASVTVNGEADNDAITVNGTDGGAQVTANGNDGDDTITVVLAPGSGAVSADGGADTDSLIVVGTAGPDDIALTGTLISIAGSGSIGYAEFETATVLGLDGDDAVVVSGLAVSLAIDGGADTDSLTFLGTAGADDITLTGTAISITGSGTIGYAFFESATILGLDGDDTIAVAADLTTALDVNGGNDSDAVSVDQPVAASVTVNGEADNDAITVNGTDGGAQVTANGNDGDDTITVVLAPGSGAVSADGGADTDSLIVVGTAGPDDIALTGTLISIAGSGSIGYAEFETATVLGLDGDDAVVVSGLAASTAIGGGADDDSFVGAFAGDFDGNLSLSGFETAAMDVGGDVNGSLDVGSPGVLGHVAVAGTLSTGSAISATVVTDVTIGTLSGLLSVSEAVAGPDAGVLSDATIGAISSTGTLSTGTINGLTVETEAAGTITAAGAGTTADVTIGTLSGTVNVPEDENPGSGVMTDTTFGSITSTGSVFTGSVSTMAVTGTMAGSILISGQGTSTFLSIGTLSGSVNVPEDQNPGSGVMVNTTIGAISSTGTLSTGTINGLTVETEAAGTITAAGAGTTADVTIGTLSGTVNVPEDENPGSGVMTDTTFGSITSTGSVFTGSVSTMAVTGTMAGSILISGQGTSTFLSIGTLSGSVNVPEDQNPGSGVMVNTTIGAISSTGTLSTGTINGLTVETEAAGTITAAGAGTTADVTIGTLSGTVNVPEDENPGSGVMTDTTFGSITSTGSVFTGSVSTMAVTGTMAGSILISGQGTSTFLSIGTLSGSVNVPEDQNPGSGVMVNTTIGSISSTGTLSTGTARNLSIGSLLGTLTVTGLIDGFDVDTLLGQVSAGIIPTATVEVFNGSITATTLLGNIAIGTVLGGTLSGAEVDVVSASTVTAPSFAIVESGTTRTFDVLAVHGFDRPEGFRLIYEANASPLLNPSVTIQIEPGASPNLKYDLSLLSDVVGTPGSGIDLAGLYGSGRTSLRNLVVAGNLVPAAANPGFFGLPPATLGGVQLPEDRLGGLAFAGNVPQRSIRAVSVQAVAFGSANGVAAIVARAVDAEGLLATGTRPVQAREALLSLAGDGAPTALFLVTRAQGGDFDAKPLLLSDQAPDHEPIDATFNLTQVPGLRVRQVLLSGIGASLVTRQPILGEITVLAGSLGDLTLLNDEPTPDISAPRIDGNLDLNGRLDGSIRAAAGDLGRAVTDPAGNVTGVTTLLIRGRVSVGGEILSAGRLVSYVEVRGAMNGVVASQGDLGVIATDASGNAIVGADGRLTRFGGIRVAGETDGYLVVLGNAFGDLRLNGRLDGRIAVKGHPVQGLPSFRTGILADVVIGERIGLGGAIASSGVIGDDGINDIAIDGAGTRLSVSGQIRGILAAAGDINFGPTGSRAAARIFEAVGTPGNPDGAAIAAIFTQGGGALTVPADLPAILADLTALKVGANGRLAGTSP